MLMTSRVDARRPQKRRFVGAKDSGDDEGRIERGLDNEKTFRIRSPLLQRRRPPRGELGALPHWRLDDLYESMEFAVASPPTSGAPRREAKAFAEAGAASSRRSPPARGRAIRLAEAVTAYEALQDLIGRVMSYASLLYASDTSDAARAKFYGDANEKVTALAGDLLFFELELNRLDDAVLDAAMAAPALARYRPWLEDIRKEKPHQLADDIEQLFLEKSVSGAAAWNRLFDDTMSALRFDFEGETLTLEPTLAKLQDPDEAKRKAAAQRARERRSGPTCASSR